MNKVNIAFILFISLNSINAKDTVTVIGVGDIMPGTDYPSARYLPPGKSCDMVFRNVCNILQDADITFGNLEGTMAGSAGEPKNCNDTTMCFVFRMPQNFIDCIKNCGFDLLSTANNHSNDFGYGGRKETQKILDNSGIHHAGYEDSPFSIFQTSDIKIGFCAFAPHSGTSDSKDYNHVKKIIEHLDTICDFVIVSIHTGAEGAKNQHLPKTDEEYLGFNRGNIFEFSHLAIDAGADIIFGHGPHVTRAVELYKNRFIAYSLGNFATYRRFNLKGPNGFAPLIKLEVDRTGKFLRGLVIPVYQEGEGIPCIDEQKRALYKLMELTNADFPDSKLDIGEDGTITAK